VGEIRRVEERVREPTQWTEVAEPVLDEEGRPLRDEEGNIVFRHRRFPAGTVDPFRMWDQVWGQVKGIVEMMKPERPEVTEETIRRVVREELPSEPPEVRGLRERLERAEERYREMEKRMEERERERLREELSSLRERIERMRTGEGYKEDSFRLVADALDRLAFILEKRKPMETVREILAPGAGRPPPKEKAPPGAREGVIERLEREGYVVRVLER